MLAGGMESGLVRRVCIDKRPKTHTRFKRKVILHAQDARGRENRSVNRSVDKTQHANGSNERAIESYSHSFRIA